MKLFPQKLINVEVSQKPPIDTVPEIVEAIREVESELGEEGRVLVRFSGTQNICRVMVEAPSEDGTTKYCERVAAAVKHAIGSMR
jgi:phosphoglucosamine mutase